MGEPKDGRYTILVVDGVMQGAPRALTELFGAALHGRAVDAAVELEAMAKRVRTQQRYCTKTARRFESEGNTSLRDHNSIRAADLKRVADMLERRAARLRKETP